MAHLVHAKYGSDKAQILDSLALSFNYLLKENQNVAIYK